jgi:hypothetical protein
MLQVIEGREVTGGHATLRHRVPVTNAQKGVGTPTAAREIPRLPAITMSVPEDPRIGGVPYQRSQCQSRRTQESEVLVDPPAPWGTRCREPGGCGTGGGQATLCVPLPYHLLIERVEDPARYKGWDPLSTRRPRIHPGAEVEVRGGIQSAASSGDARPKG